MLTISRMTRITPNTKQSDTTTSAALPCRDPQVAMSHLVAANPALEEMVQATAGKKTVSVDPFLESINRYGFSILNNDALSALTKMTQPHQGKVVSVFTGRGYAEAQMVAAGMDVIGFDKEVRSRRWLLDTHKGPQGISWDRFADRALFMSFPECTKGQKGFACDVVAQYLAAGGTTVFLVAEARPTEHAIKCDGALIKRLNEGERIARIELPKWPVIEAFVGYGHVHNTFEPVLTAYRFSNQSS